MIKIQYIPYWYESVSGTPEPSSAVFTTALGEQKY